MKKGNQPAYPRPVSEMSSVNADPKLTAYAFEGLTKRELFAAMAMQGLCSNPEFAKEQHEIASGLDGEYVMDPVLAKRSIEIADELLKQLEL